MKARSFLYGAALVIVTATITTTVVSQDAKEPPEMTPEEKAVMDKWIAFASPNENHQILAKKAGKWDLVVKWWESPDETPHESTATSQMKMVMEGRYLLDNTKGETPEGPFEGMGCTGYDNLKKKFVATWIDNMGTGIAFQEGTFDAASKTFTYNGEMPDPPAGKYVKTRTTEKWTSADVWVMESFSKGKDGKEFRQMEITYTRAK